MVRLVSFVVFYFYLFKQKTAYEMRISDWSSDVCSSDLRVLSEAVVANDPECVKVGHGLTNLSQDENGVTAHFSNGAVFAGDVLIGCDGKIGRASCRERVWQYVLLWVVADI